MRINITIAFILISLCCFSQDSTAKKDTVRVPLYEFTDTLKKNIIYADPANNLKYCQGYIIVKGYKATKDKKSKWAENPTVIAVLDEKKKSLTAKWIEIKN